MENLIILAVVAAALAVGGISAVRHFRGEGGCCGGGGTLRLKKKLDHVLGKKCVRIEGMMCENCEARVERFLNDIPGASAQASHKKKQAIVSYDRELDDGAIRAAVEKAGYRVLEIR